MSARYADNAPRAVENLSFTVPARGHTAIVGPSGAGKTTALALILRFLEPEAGTIAVRGVPYRELRPEQVRSQLAYVEQESPLIPGTLRENLLFGNPDATDAEVADVLNRIRLDEKVASLPDGLDTTLLDASLSGGQRQRIALARAILQKPAVLLLDEATAQVDALTEAAIQLVVADISRRSAVVTIAHRLSTIVDADQIIVMQDGSVVGSGTHGELLETTPLYRGLVESLRITPPSQTEVAARPVAN